MINYKYEIAKNIETITKGKKVKYNVYINERHIWNIIISKPKINEEVVENFDVSCCHVQHSKNKIHKTKKNNQIIVDLT